jgi:hypothetical protein
MDARFRIDIAKDNTIILLIRKSVLLLRIE